MSSTSPRISVVTPSFNQGAFIKTSIDSVLAQDYPNFEHIVIDGGSTDDTVAILRSYPHLIWTSEPDRGQADALNKGFRRATGDVIAWINSDDWYAPGAFHAAVERLRSYPVVMGACQMVRADGSPIELIANHPHNWFDILKYWIYDSIPTQPSIFFTRALLAEVRIEEDLFVDPSLDLVMDYDLWLRMARKHPFDQRIDSVLSYYRLHDDCKTSGDWTLVFKEAGRVFARHTKGGTGERLVFAVPMGSDQEAIERTLASLGTQQFLDFDVVLTGTESFHQRRREVYRLALAHSQIRIRYATIDSLELPATIDCLLSTCSAPVVCTVPAGVQLPPDFALGIANAFTDDRIGAVIGALCTPNGTVTPSDISASSLESLASIASQTLGVAIRRVTWQELGAATHANGGLFALARLYLRMLYKGWHLITRGPWGDFDQPRMGALGEPRNLTCFTSALMVDLDVEYRSEPVAQVRAEHGAGIRFASGDVEMARRDVEAHAWPRIDGAASDGPGPRRHP